MSVLKILNSQSKSVTGAAFVISAATLVSRVVGIIRDRVFAHYFGAGTVMDAYYAAFKIPDLIYNLLIVGALTAGFIPTFTKLFYAKEDKTPAWKLANNIINILGVVLAIGSVLGIIFTEPLAKIIAPGFTGEAKHLALGFTRIMFLSPLILGVSMVLGGILQSLKQFVLYAIAPIFYNFGIIFGAIVLTESTLGIYGLPAGVILGALFHLGVQCYGAYQNGFRWQWQFGITDPDTRLIGRLMLPRTLGIAMSQLNTVVTTILASLLPAGSVAMYNYANNLQAVPTGIIGIPFALAVFPVLSAMVAERNADNFINHLASTTRQIIFLIIPISIVVLLLRAQIVRVVLGSGEFDWTATIGVADALAFFSLGLLAQSLIPLYARGFYALSNTKTPFTLGVIAELIAIITALILMKPLGVAGLALASSIGATLNIIMLVVAFRLQSGTIHEEKLIKMFLKITVAAMLMGITIQLLKYPLARVLNLEKFWGILLHGVVSGSLGLVIYGVICRLFKVEEMIHLQHSLKKRWLKLWNVPAGIDEAEGL